MDENNVYDENEVCESTDYETEAQDATDSMPEEFETDETAEVDFEVDTEPVKEKKRRMSGWVVAVIIIAVLAALAVGIGGLSIFRTRFFPHKRYHAMPGGSISFSEVNPAENMAKSALMPVVNIESRNTFEGFFGHSMSRNSGTGVIIREDGYILTSLQLVESEGDITVKLQNGKKYTATLQKFDQVSGSALLKIDATGLDAVSIGDSSLAMVGDRVAVVGNTLNSNLSNPVTLGYICGVDSNIGLDNGNYVNLFQVDASALADSIGGLVLNAKGELIGIANGVISNSSSEIGLVTPANDLAQLMGEIVTMSSAQAVSDLKIGITGEDEDYGVAVTMVGEGTPAEAAGIKVDDLIVKVDGETVTSIAKINEIKARHTKGDTIVITVYREGEMLDLNVIL